MKKILMCIFDLIVIGLLSAYVVNAQVSPCLPSPCFNNAACINRVTTFECICAPGFTGTTCQVSTTTGDTCASLQPCLNGGMCFNGDNGAYFCSCPNGYSGNNCQEGTCQDALGMESRQIADNQLTSSSTRGTFFAPSNARLNQISGTTNAGAWSPSSADTNQYVQVNLLSPQQLTGVITQGRPDTVDEWVTQFRVQYSLDGVNWVYVTGQGSTQPQVFSGNSDRNTAVTNIFSSPVDGQYVRINPTAWNGYISMRLELLGCNQASQCASLQPCLNGAQCVDTSSGGYTCQCTAGFTGTNCGITSSMCLAFTPCLNNAQCIDIGSTSYTCQCATGYTGNNCQISTVVSGQCQSLQPCLNGAQCTDTATGGYNCVCQSGFTGTNCGTVSSQCLISSPCFNGAQCIDTANGGYTCLCTSQYQGVQCQQLITVTGCNSNPCVNQGTCFETDLGYTCSCTRPWVGTHCETADSCVYEPCANGGTCTNINNALDSTCDCLNNWMGTRCETANPCLSNPCLNGGSCLDIDRGDLEAPVYSCSCPAGWIGQRCEMVEFICTTTQPCFNGATCVDIASGQYVCQCPIGYRGTRCEEVIGPCEPELNPCQNEATCLAMDGANAVCICSDLYRGTFCQTLISPCDASLNPCQNDAQCVEVSNTAVCLCTDSYRGVYCEIVILPCESGPCLNGAMCFDNDAGFSCQCSAGFTGVRCGTAVLPCDIGNNPCVNGATCTQTNEDPPSAICICARGFTGETCNEIAPNPCDSAPCMNDGVCYDNINSYTCQCTAEYTGIQCQIAVRPCDPGINPCLNGATCVEVTSTSVLCVCVAGFEGDLCQNTLAGPCASNPCINEGTCYENDDNGFTCSCLAQYTGQFCEQDYVNPCAVQPCRNGATCFEDGLIAYCLCTNQYEGTFCEVPVDNCASNPCHNGGTCIPEYLPLGPYTCECAQNFTGVHCQIEIKGGCASGPCQNDGECWDRVDMGYVCTCLDGYDGRNCEEETCVSKECMNNGVCKMLLESSPNFNMPYCECNGHWKGKFCDIATVTCSPNPCLNGGICQLHENSTSCICKNDYIGDQCEEIYFMQVKSPFALNGTPGLPQPSHWTLLITTITSLIIFSLR